MHSSNPAYIPSSFCFSFILHILSQVVPNTLISKVQDNMKKKLFKNIFDMLQNCYEYTKYKNFHIFRKIHFLSTF